MTQDTHPISLNALRVFLGVAERGSIKLAADAMNVTPGAISHQVRTLEDGLGVKLLRRTNNSIALTPAGQQLLQDALPGTALLNAAIDRVRRDANELRVQVSLTFATRWLVPRLHHFQQRNPNAKIKIETTFGIERGPNPDADVSIEYVRRGQASVSADILFEDICRPYVSPKLLLTHKDFASLPALQSAEGNWDWALWKKHAGLEGVPLKLAARFDVDDAALRAAIAGLGMVLTSEFMIEDDLAEGHLCPMPNSAKVALGAYVIHQSTRQTGLSQRFTDWLHKAAHETS